MRKMQLNRRHSSRGMTLVELLVVMAMLSVVMLAVMSLVIPMQQSTAAQTQVSDVNANLRLAVKTMTQDLLVAGFLVPNNPVVFPDATPDVYDPDTRGTTNSSEFIIRTRTVGHDFARVLGVTSPNPVSGGFRLEVTDPAMVARFPVGSRVRLFEPISSNEVMEEPAIANDDDRAYPVIGTGTGTIDISTAANSSLSAARVLGETVVLRVRDSNQPPLQTIRYRLNNGVLERIINDVTPGSTAKQILTRNVDTTNTTAPSGTSFFEYAFTPEGRVNRVDINLTGKTKALKNDAISGEKKRAVVTSVKLRNVF